ncbi:hypothetical protein E4U43_006290 [Claviceps pusilla]|uniref:C6 transcription factor n=1 Tax=Claviceps pusilla TaxID=123648 RepID=A0A9P7N2I6_9HYPO|nr:hypothetical protein E4U43_006290 [Claviceps pusilla]
MGNTRNTRDTRSPFQHAPTPYTLAWLAVSLPLVIWDTGYVLGRPHTMPGGTAHWPLWTPYKLYGEVDHVYGWKALRDKSGFTAAQSSLNVAETVLYLAYLYIWRFRGGRDHAQAGKRPAAWVVGGRAGALALLLGFSAAVMTLSKTLLYWANEYFSDFANVGHNDFSTLLRLWIIPNGAWIVGSAYMVLSMGTEILDKLERTARGKSD